MKAVTFDDIQQLAVPSRGQRICYADRPQTFGELRLPEHLLDSTALIPIVVVIHGGCWRSENDMAHIEHLSAALTRAGVATWTIEYRRIGDKNGGWTGTFDDVSAGADFVRTLGQRFPIDLKRVVFLGHSAGGHLALWLALRQNLPESSLLYCPNPLKPCGVVSLAGITDLRSYGASSGYCNDSVALLLGGTPDQVPAHYDQASPVEMLPAVSPMYILHGTLDAVVPLQQSGNFLDRALAAKCEVELLSLEGAGHFDLIAPFSDAWQSIEEIVLKMSKKSIS